MDILQYDFMQHAFMAGIVVAILSAVLGYFVVLRNLSFASHALGHISFSGATAALLFGFSPMLGQLVLTLLSALLMGCLGDRVLKSDMTIGIVLAFSLGLGSLFLSLSHGYTGQATSILFGNLLGVSTPSLILMCMLTIVCLLVLMVLARPLLFASLEPELAQARGIPLTRLGVIFLCLLAVGVTLASQVVGVLLIFTLLIGPAAIATRWTKQFWSGLVASVIVSVLIVVMSLVLTYFTAWPISFWVSALVLLAYIIPRRCLS